MIRDDRKGQRTYEFAVLLRSQYQSLPIMHTRSSIRIALYSKLISRYLISDESDSSLLNFVATILPHDS